MSPEEKAAALRMRTEGKKTTEIANTLERPYFTIWKFFKVTDAAVDKAISSNATPEGVS